MCQRERAEFTEKHVLSLHLSNYSIKDSAQVIKVFFLYLPAFFVFEGFRRGLVCKFDKHSPAANSWATYQINYTEYGTSTEMINAFEMQKTVRIFACIKAVLGAALHSTNLQGVLKTIYSKFQQNGF